MASNELPDSVEKLLAMADEAADGARDTVADGDINLLHNTETAIRADRTALFNASQAANTSFKALNSAKTTRSNADKAATRLIRKAIRILQPILGDAGSAWLDTGIGPDVLQPAATQDERVTQLERLDAFLTAHPAYESALTNPPVTAANCATVLTALTNAIEAVNDARTAHQTALAVETAAEEALRHRLRGLIGELTQLIGDFSPLWYEFGFNEPGALAQPEKVTGLTLLSSPPGLVNLDWDDAMRAERYHVWLQILGVDAEPQRYDATFLESKGTLQGLESVIVVRIHVVALNDDGEGPASDILEITVP